MRALITNIAIANLAKFPSMMVSPFLMCCSLIRDRVPVAARIGAGTASARDRGDHHCGCASGHSESRQTADVVTASSQLVINSVRNCRFDIQFVEAGSVGPERTVEVKRLDARPFKGRMKVRVPVVPEVD